MNKIVTFRIDDKVQEKLEWLQDQLNISVSDIIRMAIPHFAKYVEKVNK